MPSPLRIVELAAQSEVGPMRQHNEDRYLADAKLIAVADGMGGARAGEIAAQMAVDSLEAIDGRVGSGELAEALRRANREIHSAAAAPDKAGMGTTATAGVVEGDRLFLAHVGDSRAYLWRGGALEALTEDHSVVAELVRSGQLTAAEAAAHPHRNVITRALGAAPSVDVDTPEQGLIVGDIILLCSDGLCGGVTDAQIAATIGGGGGLEAIAGRLVEVANETSGTDNVTVVLGRVGEESEALPIGGSLEGAPLGEARPSLPVFEEAQSRSRRGLRPLVVGTATLIALAAGAFAWVDSRSFSLNDSGGEVEVSRGLPFGLERTWQPTGVDAAAVAESAPEAFDGGTRGRGEVVRDAVSLIWSQGVPEVAPLEGPPPEPESQPRTNRPDSAAEAAASEDDAP